MHTVRILVDLLRNSAMQVAIYRMLAILMSFGFAIVAARILGDVKFGQYTTLMAMASLATVLCGAGLPKLVGRELAAGRGSLSTKNLSVTFDIFKIHTFILFLLFLIAMFSLEGISRLVVALVAFSLIQTQMSSILMAYEKVEEASLIGNVYKPVLALILCGLLYLVDRGNIFSVVLSQIIALVLSICVFAISLMRLDLSLIQRAVRNWGLFKIQLKRSHFYALISSLHLGLGQFMVILKTQAEIIWLSILASPTDVAYFFAATRAASAVVIFHSAVLAIAAPKIHRYQAQNNIRNRNEVIQSATRQSFFLVCLSSSGIFAISDLIFMTFGPGFGEGKLPLAIMLASWIVVSFFGPVTQVLVGLRKEDIIWKLSVISFVLGAIVAFLLVPMLGISGAALSFFISNVAWTIMMASVVRRSTGISLPLIATRQSNS